MKSLFLAIVSLLSFLPSMKSVSDSSFPYNYVNTFDYIQIKPYEPFLNTTLTVKLSFLKSPILSGGKKQISYSAYYVSKGIVDVFYEGSTSTYEYYEEVTYKPTYICDEIEFTFQVYMYEKEAFSKSCRVKKKEKKRIYYTNTNEGEYTPGGYIYRYSFKGGEKQLTEKYVFNGFGGYGIGAYNSIDFSSLNFYYYCDDYDFTYKNAYVLFPNINNELDNLGAKSGNYQKFSIYISFDKTTKLATLTLNESFFVNPVTRRMSSKEEVGYAKTKFLYISDYTLEQMQIRKFSVVIENTGFNNNTYYLSLALVKQRYLFGTFDNADNKMCSSPAEAVFDIGKVYEHHD